MDPREVKISSYTSGFNLIKNEFEWQKSLTNHTRLTDETVVAINTSEDGTLEAVKAFAERNDKIKVIETDFSYLDPDLDGKIKNAALQATRYDVKVGLDMDEVVNPAQKKRWYGAGQILLEQEFQAFFIPVIDLYENIYHYKSLGQKWYMHKSGLYRGTVNFAKNPDGTHDVNKSDSCELIDERGNLVESRSMVSLSTDAEETIVRYIAIENLPCVFHLGFFKFEKEDPKKQKLLGRALVHRGRRTRFHTPERRRFLF